MIFAAAIGVGPQGLILADGEHATSVAGMGQLQDVRPRRRRRRSPAEVEALAERIVGMLPTMSHAEIARIENVEISYVGYLLRKRGVRTHRCADELRVLVAKARSVIRDRYTTHEVAAAEVGVSPGYLSVLFSRFPEEVEA